MSFSWKAYSQKKPTDARVKDLNTLSRCAGGSGPSLSTCSFYIAHVLTLHWMYECFPLKGLSCFAMSALNRNKPFILLAFLQPVWINVVARMQNPISWNVNLFWYTEPFVVHVTVTQDKRFSEEKGPKSLNFYLFKAFLIYAFIFMLFFFSFHTGVIEKKKKKQI